MSKKNLTWLWLSERPENHPDIVNSVKEAGIDYEIFSHVSHFTEKLLEIKQDKNKNFQDYGLISSVRLTGQAMIMSPKELNGVEDSYFKTNMGYDAGFVFYRNLILGNPEEKAPSIWTPNALPPTVFLSILGEESMFVKQYMKEIKRDWAKLNNSAPDEAKVKFIRKWDYDPELSETLKSWSK